MKLDLKIHKGKDSKKPMVILIHGLGMNRYFWGDPGKCEALGGLTDLNVFLSRPPVHNKNSKISTGVPPEGTTGLADRLLASGYSIAAWSQAQPMGPTNLAVDELGIVLHKIKDKWPEKSIYLVGHSRGGIIARKYILSNQDNDVKGVITLCSPHRGTKMASFSIYLEPLGNILEKIIPNESRNTMILALRRLADFLKTPAAIELQPGSDFMKSMSSPLPSDIRKLSFGGTDPVLFKLYIRINSSDKWNVLPFPDLLLRAIPSKRLPQELKAGSGDSLVSAKSAILSDGQHYNFSLNHVGMSFDAKVQDTIVDFLKD